MNSSFFLKKMQNVSTGRIAFFFLSFWQRTNFFVEQQTNFPIKISTKSIFLLFTLRVIFSWEKIKTFFFSNEDFLVEFLDQENILFLFKLKKKRNLLNQKTKKVSKIEYKKKVTLFFLRRKEYYLHDNGKVVRTYFHPFGRYKFG